MFHELNSLSGIYEENLQNIKKNKVIIFDSLDQLLDASDGIVICTQQTHCEIAVKALKNGVDIILRNPSL